MERSNSRPVAASGTTTNSLSAPAGRRLIRPHNRAASHSGLDAPKKDAPKKRKVKDRPVPLANAPTKALEIGPSLAMHRGAPAMMSRVRAADDVAGADAAAADVAAEAARKAAIARCRAAWMTNKPLGAGRPPQRITTTSTVRRRSSRVKPQTAPACRVNQSVMTTGASVENQPEKAIVTPTALHAVGGVEAVAAAGVAAVAIAKATSARAHSRIARAAYPPAMMAISMTNRCRQGMACGLPRGQRTPVGPMPPGKRAADRGRKAPASRLEPQELKAVKVANPVAVVVGAAAAAKDAAATLVALHLQPRAAGRVRHPAVPPEGANNAAADVAVAEAGATSGDPHRPSTVAVAMNLPRWRGDARRMTRAWSFSASKMPATTAASATIALQRMTMTASSRAGSTMCSTCPVGWRPSAS